MKKLSLLTILVLCISCTPPDESADNFVPEWSKSAIYYQIFVERFRNGDPSNDPTPSDIGMTYPENIPENWAITPWGQDWYKPDAYHSQMDSSYDFYSKIQLRRYGGDLQGVLDKVDYLANLGITAVYFNPLNDSPSLHKYDPRYYHHIDRNFGPDPEGDKALMLTETPDDPATWQWTAADQLFLRVIKAFHQRGIRVILDYSFNHTGYDFWAVNDIRKQGRNSKYVDWYDIEQFDDPATPENETRIKGWWGFKYLPLFKEEVINPDTKPPHEGNIVSSTLKQHIFDVSKRWLDPNGDGEFDDGVDGYRLDVAAEVSMGFWREYRTFIKDINPEALLIGEVWWFDKEDLSGPEKMVQGDAFDALMNYRWYLTARGFFSQGEPKMKPSTFIAQWQYINQNISTEAQQAMMNIAGTHDTPRLSTCFFNDTWYKERAKLSENATYKVHRPDAGTWQEVKMFLLHQYTFVGAPQIWNGDEKGMWGADDPDNRKPVWWEDIAFEPEKEQAFSARTVPADTPSIDEDLIKYYQKLISIRKKYPALSNGTLEFIHADDDRMLLAYQRSFEDEKAIVAFNRSDEMQTIRIPVANGKYINPVDGQIMVVSQKALEVKLPAISGQVWLNTQ